MDAGGAALDVRALFQIQSQALKAALAQVDASQTQIWRALQAQNGALQAQIGSLRGGPHDAGDTPAAPSPTPPAHDPAREAAVAAIAQLDAKTKVEVEQDEPAVTYDRVRNAVIALVVIDCALAAIAVFTGGAYGMAYQVRVLFAPLAVTGTYLLFFGTLDSSAMAATAARTYRAYMIVAGALAAVVYAVYGKYAEAVFFLVWCWFGYAYYLTWLLTTMRERMRTRFQGKLAERTQLYTSRLLHIVSVQMALLVQGLAQGVGPHSTGRNLAICTFSLSLALAWVLSAGVYDAGEADTQRRATRLRLSFRESAALVSSMLYVLTGLAGYVMAGQDDPDADTATLLLMVSNVCIPVAAVLVGRLVKDAKNKEQARDPNAAGGVRMVAKPAQVAAQHQQADSAV